MGLALRPNPKKKKKRYGVAGLGVTHWGDLVTPKPATPYLFLFLFFFFLFFFFFEVFFILFFNFRFNFQIKLIKNQHFYEVKPCI
jgi:hypothetical protein